MQHVSKFQLIEPTTYLFLLVSLDKVTMSVLRAICENPGRKKKSPITRAAKNWQTDSKNH